MKIRTLPIALALPVLSAVSAVSAVAADPPDALAQARLDAQALVRNAATQAAPAQVRIEIVPGTLDPRLRLAPCDQIESYLPRGARAWGRTRVGLRCVQGRTHWNVSLPVTVKVYAPALVSTSALAAGSTLEASQLQTAEVDWAAEPSPVLLNAEALAGRVLARPLAAGQALRSTDLRARQWFTAGDSVSIVAAGAGFAVSGEGQALSNGIEGRPARVRTEGGRVLSGLPVGERRIEVAL